MNVASHPLRHLATDQADGGKTALRNWYAEQARLLADRAIALAFDCHMHGAAETVRQAALKLTTASKALRV